MQGTIKETPSAIHERVRLVSDHKVAFTKALAEKLTGHKQTDWERPLSDGHLAHLKYMMRTGRFHTEWVCLCTCDVAGVRYLINGKHTCYARFFEMPEGWNPPVRLVHYEADNEEAMREVYSLIDRGKSRGTNNIVDSLLSGTDRFQKVDKRALRTLVSGYRMFRTPAAQGVGITVDQACQEINTPDNSNLAHVCLSLLGSYVSQRFLWRQAVVAAMFATLSKSVKHGEEFWGAVRDGANMPAGDPRLKLRTYLLTHHQHAGAARGAAGRSLSASAEEILRCSIYAWNAWRSNKPLLLLQPRMNNARPTVSK